MKIWPVKSFHLTYGNKPFEPLECVRKTRQGGYYVSDEGRAPYRISNNYFCYENESDALRARLRQADYLEKTLPGYRASINKRLSEIEG